MGGMLTIKAKGADASEAIEELEKLVENKFGET
jgi:phosphotransferase system HPr-like phosphotransfer protein